MSVAITLTTINRPTIINNIIDDCRDSEIVDDLHIIIMGDKKSPNDNKEYCKNVDLKNCSIKIDYFDLKDQKDHFQKKYPNLYKHIPINSFARRNFADLLSMEEGHQYTIRIDDDNFPIKGEPFVLGHLSSMQKRDVCSLSSDNGWFNVCETLENDTNQKFYPRGYPYEKRWENSQVIVETVGNPSIGVNAGLWYGDPDIDAITRLHKPINVTKFDANTYGESFILGRDTNCPINTQNTCYSNDILRIAFVSPHAGRYDDIICGYVINSLRNKHDFDISFGKPILFQERNAHNLWNDLRLELNGNEHIHRLLSLLDEFEKPKRDLVETYLSVVEELWPELGFAGDYLQKIFQGMRVWSQDLLESEL